MNEIKPKLGKSKIKENQMWMEAILDGIQDVIYVADPETYQLLFVNQTFMDSWDGDPVGKLCYQVLQEREDPCPFCTNHLIFGENLGQTHIWEFQNQVTGHHYHCSDRAVRWTDGRWVRFEIATDITKRVEVEQTLKSSERLYRALAEASPEMIFLIDDQDRVVYLNQAAAKMFGVDKEEILGKARSALFPPQIAREQSKGLQHVRSSGQKLHSKSQVVFPGGDIWLSTWLVPVEHEGKIPSVLGISQDITQSYQAEEKLKQKVMELERFNQMAVGREKRMVELKREINRLLADQGQPARYSIPEQVIEPDRSSKS